MESRNRFQGMSSASQFSLAGRYYNPIPTRFLAPIDCLKIPAQYLTVAAQIQGPPNKPQKMLIIDRMTMSKWRPFPFSSYTNRRLILHGEQKVRNTMQLLGFRRKKRLIEGNAKCSDLKKLIFKWTLRQVFICLRPRTNAPLP